MKMPNHGFQVTDHTAYALKEKDYQDMMAPHQRFGAALPEAYAAWREWKDTLAL